MSEPAFLAAPHFLSSSSALTPSLAEASSALRARPLARTSAHSSPNCALNLSVGMFSAAGLRMVAFEAIA